MSFHTWSTNGFGICVDDILEKTSLNLQKFLDIAAMEPSVLKIVEQYIDEICEEDKISRDDFEIEWFDELEGDYGERGLAFILYNVIKEIPVVYADGFNGDQYILYCPSYPWTMHDNERELSEEDVTKIFKKYVSILTDIPIEVDYYSVENGG